MKRDLRKTIFEELQKFDVIADKGSYVEVTEWTNKEGIDIDINGKKSIALTYGELEAIYILGKLVGLEDDQKNAVPKA